MEALTEDQKSHALTPALVDEALGVKENIALFQERLDKLEKTKEDFSQSVYQKVKQDYTDKLQASNQKFLSLKKELDQDRQIILNKKKTLQEHHQAHQETLEEARLRASLEEYTEAQFKKIEKEESTQLKQLEESIRDLESEVKRFEQIFGALPEPVTSGSISITKKPEPQTAKFKVSDGKVDKANEAKEEIGEKTLPKFQNPAPEPSVSVKEAAKFPQIVHLEKDKVIEKIPVDKTIEIGRSPSNHIVLNEPKVSRRHAEIQHVGGKYVLVDLESSNGTYVQGKKVKEYPLQPNDEIKIGNATLVFQI